MKKIVLVSVLIWVTSCCSFVFGSIIHSISDPGLNTKCTGPDSTTVQSVNSSSRIPNEILDLYPLAIGNKWIYLEKHVINPNVWYEVKLREVVGDSLAANGKFYFHLKQDDYHYLDRVDSTEGKVYRYYEHSSLQESEYLIANLLGEVGDSVSSFDPSYTSQYSYIKIIEIDTISRWGLYSIRKIYQQITPGPLHVTTTKLTEGIGMESILTGLPLYGISSEQTLKGCVINGVVYGDTTLTGTDEEENSLLTDFKLYQNYPNPFNPSTKISWQTPVSSWQTLKVYDVLGNEVATLVDEYKNADSYELEFNASNLPSGVYFYQLKVENFLDTKKMIFLK